MTKIRLPFHRSFQEAEITESMLRAVLSPHCQYAGVPGPGVAAQRQTVAAALDNPLSAPRLEDLAVGKRSAAVITSDHTRPVPSRITLPLLLERLRRKNPGVSITIVVATGSHRSMSANEMRDKFGAAVVRREKFFMHDCTDNANLRHLGQLPSGGELWLNRHALEADLLVAEGFIEPHFFAGFSGGRKSVLPGIAGRASVLANHCAAFIDSPRARAGCLDGNPIHEDMLFAARKAGLAFILNVTLNSDKTIRAAFAGDPEAAHAAGCRQLAREVAVKRVEADIVITGNGGYPLDQNIYQSVKGMTAAEACCRAGGVIIMAAGCCDGTGGDCFYRALAEAESPGRLLARIRGVPQNETPQDQWEYQILARVLSKCRVILVTDLFDAKVVESMHMLHAASLRKALDMAMAMCGPDAGCVVIPDGVSVIVDQE
ncbi:MAG: nickel-dependent lactate racemase [Kiritimatiellae bacterium]|nr:nickel-dependent lactate racemase [Kiritimatiellia bacterium]